MEPARAERLAPRRSARLQGFPPPPPPPRHWLSARCSPADAAAPCGFTTLPDDVLIRVFTALPADARARCASVCRAWAHALLRGPDAWRCWTRLDLSGGSGVVCTKRDAALEGAAALARGHLQELDLAGGGEYHSRVHITLGALLRVLRISTELHELSVDIIDAKGEIELNSLRQLLAAAAPTLRRLDADKVFCHFSADSLSMLRAEPPYGPLRVRFLEVDSLFGRSRHEDIGAVAVARRFGAAVMHAWVRSLYLVGITWTEPAALDALADALLARTCRVEELSLKCCVGLSPAYVPALARLLAGRDGAPLASVAAADCKPPTALFAGASEADVEQLCDALRRTTLTRVSLFDVGLTQRIKDALRQAAAVAPRLSLQLY